MNANTPAAKRNAALVAAIKIKLGHPGQDRRQRLLGLIEETRIQFRAAQIEAAKVNFTGQPEQEREALAAVWAAICDVAEQEWPREVLAYYEDDTCTELDVYLRKVLS